MAKKTLWATLNEFLVHKGNGNGMPQKKWSNNTWVLKNFVDNSIAVRLHGTDIVRAAPNGDITLRTGGYHTVTTKSRINEFLGLADTGWKVFQKNHDWYITHYAGGGVWDVTEPFEDGMTLYAVSEPVDEKVDPLLEQLLAEEELIEKQAAASQKAANEAVMMKIAAESAQEKAMLNELNEVQKLVHAATARSIAATGMTMTYISPWEHIMKTDNHYG